ncbi:MAG TPA: DUF2357 domain-containing protein [Sphingobacteriaceae bacterium]
MPTPAHRDPHLLQDLDSYTDDYMCAGPVNFRRQVGLSTLEIRVGHETLRITIEVFPVKIDYNQDYKTLLSDVASAGRGLALEYLRATYRSASTQDAEHTTNLEWLTLLRNEIDVLEKAVNYINQHPHRSLSRDFESVSLQKIKRIDPVARRSIMRGQGHGERIDVPGIGLIYNSIPATQNRDTLDTPENRWLQLNLSLIYDHLREIHASIAIEIARYTQSRHPIPKRLVAEEKEVAGFVAIIKRLVTLPVFSGIRGLPPSGFTSLTLLSSSGYSEAYRAITVLRMGLNISGDRFDISVMDVHDLYETWCFIQLLQIVTQLTKGQVDSNTLVRIEESGVRVKLRRGEQSKITYARYDGEQRLVVAYNPEYPGLTGNQRPDIVLHVQNNNWPELIIVFDAKYRLDASEEYRRRFGTAGPPQDAINALHRYRDAIVVDSAERTIHRPVVKGVALFPLTTEESQNFASSKLFSALRILGIGALPFLPTNTSHVETWIRDVLALPPEALAEPGPPFAGLSEIQRKTSVSNT